MENKNIENLTKEISCLIYDSQSLCEILMESDLERQKGTLVDIINKNLHLAFEYTEKCRQMISTPD